MITDLCKKTIFGKYKVLKPIEKGAFGYVFKAKNILTNELVALKAEDWKIKGNFLESEAYFLYNLRNFGIPEIKSFGSYKKYKILVQTLLGENLLNLVINKLYNTNLKDICLIAIQLLDRLEFIHSKYVIHCDLKPGNLLVDLETGTNIYLIDFGFAKKYRSGKTKKHIKYSIIKKFTGTLRYSSVNATKGAELSRRDDLESAGYVLIYLATRKSLPWFGLKAPTKMQRFISNYRMKKNIKPEVLCENLPEQFCEYMKYVRNLKFEEDPDYNKLRWLFMSLLISMHLKNDLGFSWVSKNDKKLRRDSNSRNQKDNLSLKRKESPQIRIFRNIKNSKEKEILNKNIEQNENIKILKEEQDNKMNRERNNIKLVDIPIKKKNYNRNRDSKSYDLNNRVKKVDIESQKAQFKVDINFDNYSEETKYKREIKESSNSNDINQKLGEKFNLEEFRKKNYININYISIYNKLEPQKDKNINIAMNKSLPNKGKSRKINKSMDNTKKIPNVNNLKKGKINIIKNKAVIYNRSPQLDKLFKRKIVKKTNNNQILNNLKIKKISEISLDDRSNLESKKNQINIFEVPRKVKPFNNKINDAIKKLLNGKKIISKQINLDGVKYNQTYIKTNILTKRQNSRREPINYNKMNIRKPNNIERRINSYNKDRHFNNKINDQISNNIIKTYSYKKIFDNSYSINENSTIEIKNSLRRENYNKSNSYYQSIIKMKYLRNKNDKFYINNKILTNLNIIKIKPPKMIGENKEINLNLVPNNIIQYSDERRKRFSNSRDYKINNIKISQIFNEKVRKNKYRSPQNVVKVKNNISKIHALGQNINIKRKLNFPISNYLNKSINHLNLTRNHNYYFTHKIGNNNSY